MAYRASVGDSEHFHRFSFQPPPQQSHTDFLFSHLLREIADDAMDSPPLSATVSGRLQKLPIWTASVQASGLSSRQSGSAELMTKGEVMLPGLQTVLAIQDRRHVYMFEELVARCAPHLFGAVLLEDQEEVHLEKASGNVGTLMEVASCKRLADGRLLLHVLGICRIRMDEVNQTAPYVRADCVVLPDEEEIQFLLTTGTGQVMAKVRKLEALSQDVLATLEDGYFQRASLMVAREAAAAWSLAWRSYEAPLQIAALALRKSAESGNLGDIVPVNLDSQPEDTMHRAQAAASQAALLYTAEALELVGYRPMMREYQGPMMREYHIVLIYIISII
jgi:Lon protease-like protein